MPIIGRGIFQWDAAERRSDRYGTFALVAHDEDSAVSTSGEKHVFSDFVADDGKAFLDITALSFLLGKPASIKAKVIETRQSRHIGDLFRNIAPTTPEIGEIIDLGIGTLFIEKSNLDACCGNVFIGLAPNDGRSSDWFDPRKLYRLHCQTVEIEIEPAE